MATELQGDGILTQHDADILGQYIAHEIDPRCQPDPFRSTVTVPEILDDETPNQYQACLDTLSLNGNVTTLNATDTTVANGAVVETAPEAGTEVTLETQVDVAANPSQAVGSHYTEDCDPNGTGQSGSPVGNPPPDGTGYPYFQLVQGSPYDVSTDPRSGGPSYPVDEMPLRWGTVGWGWQHIRENHAYTTLDRSQTIAALDLDLTPTPTGFPSTDQWDFHLFYEMDDGAGGTLDCVRTVRVEYHLDPKAQAQGVGGIRGIQSSYTGVVVP